MLLRWQDHPFRLCNVHNDLYIYIYPNNQTINRTASFSSFYFCRTPSLSLFSLFIYSFNFASSTTYSKLIFILLLKYCLKSIGYFYYQYMLSLIIFTFVLCIFSCMDNIPFSFFYYLHWPLLNRDHYCVNHSLLHLLSFCYKTYSFCNLKLKSSPTFKITKYQTNSFTLWVSLLIPFQT